MSGANATNLIIGVAVVALLVSRQLMARRLNDNYRLSVILAIIGLVQFVNFIKSVHGPHDDGRIIVAVVGSLLLAGVLGAARALTVRVWQRGDGQLMRQGTWITAVLWVLSLAVHLGYDELVAGSIDGKQAFLAASDTGLSGTTVIPGVSNIFDVDYYQRPDEIPAEYLPPTPAITFAEDLPTADR